MKQTAYLFVFLIILGCDQSNLEQINKQEDSTDNSTVNPPHSEKLVSLNDSNLQKQIEHQRETLNYEFEKATLFNLSDTIIADFNSDGNPDQATYIKENETSGIKITHGETNEIILIGFGKPFAHLTELNWVDFWGLVNDTETFEIVIEDDIITGDRKAKLENPSIVVRKDEVGGGLITYRNGQYEWVHQAD